MEEEVLKIFLEVRGRFGDIKEKVYLLKTYFELHRLCLFFRVCNPTSIKFLSKSETDS